MPSFIEGGNYGRAKKKIMQKDIRKRLPLGIRIIANAAIVIFGYLTYKSIFWSIYEVRYYRHSHHSNVKFIMLTFIIAFILSVLMRIGLRFANYALGCLCICMGYIFINSSNDNPGLMSILGYTSIFIGFFLLLTKLIFKSNKEIVK